MLMLLPPTTSPSDRPRFRTLQLPASTAAGARTRRCTDGPWWCLLAIAITTLGTVDAADLTSEYEWKPLKMGGATYFTNIWVHPTEPGLVYVDADTAGGSRWNPATSSWIPLTTAATMPRPPGGYYTGYPVALSLVGSPSHPDIAYQVVDDRLVNGNSGNVYRSTNRGATWTLPGPLNIFVAPNAHSDARDSGPRLAVDPIDPNLVYFGSQRNGLWRTTNGGATWSQVMAVPTSANKGVTVVRIDPHSGVVNGRTRRIWAAVHGSGIWTSGDGGETWSNSGGLTDDVHAMKVARDGVVLAVTRGGPARKFADGAWTTITPAGASGLRAIAVDPTDARRLLLIAGFGGNPWYSTDQGATWRQLTRQIGDAFPWQAQFYGNGGGGTQIGEIEFDPADPRRVWAGEAYGIWQGEIAAETITWHNRSAGTEGTASHAVAKPPGGAALTANMDLGIFRHPDPDAYTSVQVTSPSGNNFTHGWSVTYCATQPTFVAAISAPGNAFTREESGYSTEGGRQGSWVRFPTLPPYRTETPTGIAISATNPDNLVIYDSSQNHVYATSNRGGSWSTFSLGTPMLTSWGPGHGAIVADRVQGGTFYVYDWGNDGRFWRSTDGGATWTMASSALPGAAYANLQSTPGNAGHLWWSGGKVGNQELPLYRSTDFGSTWQAVPGTLFARSAAAGKAAPGANYPTVYLYGKVGGVEGVWRSTDNTVTWDRIAEVAPLGIYQASFSMDADQEVFGAVYLVLSGTGSAWGHPKSAFTLPPSSPQAQLGNLSVLTSVDAAQPLTVGFVVDRGSRELLVRAAGPALQTVGLDGVLPDPQLEIRRGSLTVGGSDNWDSALAPRFVTAGAFAFPAGSADAALLHESAEPETVRAGGAGGGRMLVEIYAMGGSGRLANLSTLHRAGRGGDALVAGFYVAGSGRQNVLIRAIGPGLSTFGVDAPLANPRLEVFNATGVSLASNDDWPASLASTFKQVGAFTLPEGSRDASLLVGLDAGQTYTVGISGNDERVGPTLLEIYAAP